MQIAHTTAAPSTRTRSGVRPSKSSHGSVCSGAETGLWGRTLTQHEGIWNQTLAQLSYFIEIKLLSWQRSELCCEVLHVSRGWRMRSARTPAANPCPTSHPRLLCRARRAWDTVVMFNSSREMLLFRGRPALGNTAWVFTAGPFQERCSTKTRSFLRITSPSVSALPCLSPHVVSFSTGEKNVFTLPRAHFCKSLCASSLVRQPKAPLSYSDRGWVTL